VADLILHIAKRTAWEEARATGTYAPASLAADGFIHFSDVDQVVRVANLGFPGVGDLVLLCVLADRLSAPLRYEAGDGDDERFPHLYGTLNLDAVIDVVAFPGTRDGFVLPSISRP